MFPLTQSMSTKLFFGGQLVMHFIFMNYVGIFLEGTWLLELYMRLLGASVGLGCKLHTMYIFDNDLVEIRDNVVLDAHRGQHVGNNLCLQFANVHLGSGSLVQPAVQ